MFQINWIYKILNQKMDHLFILILIESFSGSSVKSNKSSQPINTSTKKIGPRMQQ